MSGGSGAERGRQAVRRLREEIAARDAAGESLPMNGRALHLAQDLPARRRRAVDGRRRTRHSAPSSSITRREKGVAFSARGVAAFRQWSATHREPLEDARPRPAKRGNGAGIAPARGTAPQRGRGAPCQRARRAERGTHRPPETLRSNRPGPDRRRAAATGPSRAEKETPGRTAEPASRLDETFE